MWCKMARGLSPNTADVAFLKDTGRECKDSEGDGHLLLIPRAGNVTLGVWRGVCTGILHF